MSTSPSKGSSTKRRARPRRTRADILDAAARAFSEQGYQETSIQQIADDLGILKGSVYYHIKSKEEMLFEILLSGHRDVLETVHEVLQIPGAPLQRIGRFVEADASHVAVHLKRMVVFFHDFRSLTPEHREEIVAIRDEYERLLRDLIMEGQADGSICPDLDPKLISIEIFAIRNSVPTWYKPEGRLSPSALGDAIADFVVAGLACDPRTHAPGHRKKLRTGAPAGAVDGGAVDNGAATAVDPAPRVASEAGLPAVPAAADDRGGRDGWLRRRLRS